MYHKAITALTERLTDPTRASSQINYRTFLDSTRRVHPPPLLLRASLLANCMLMILLIWGPQWKSVGTTGYHSAHGVVDFTSNPIIINTWDGISQGELITRSILVMGVASAGQLCWPGKKSMRAKYFQLVSIEPQGGKACCSQLGESSNHSGLRLAIRFVALSFFFFLSCYWDGQWMHNEPNRTTTLKSSRLCIRLETAILLQRFIDFPSFCSTTRWWSPSFRFMLSFKRQTLVLLGS